ncbi:DUF2239 family protein [bacterium]|nr:DUF2239 family protein [bacterium]
MKNNDRSYTAFLHNKIIASGKIDEVVSVARQKINQGENARIAIFDDETAYVIDIDFRGSEADVLGRLNDHPMLQQKPESQTKRSPGRPKLGVVPREVGLLPRHWEWLSSQRGGASAALRKLVDEARQRGQAKELIRKTEEAAHRFMWDMASNSPDFEEASRAFYAHNFDTFQDYMKNWDDDIVEYIMKYVKRLQHLHLQEQLNSSPE